MGRTARLGGLLAVAAIACACPVAAAAPFGASATAGEGPSVELEPIVMTGASFPDLDGAVIADFGLFRWDPTSGTFVAIPFQVDERVDHTFNAGTEYEITQNIHDIFGEEDGTLDGDDELVFLYREAGDQAPAEAPWPSGAGSLRYEIELEDQTGEVSTPKWVYLYTGVGLDISPESLVSWQIGRDSTIATDLYAIDYIDRWLLVGYRVLSPCGDGGDLIDRVKGRAGLAVDQGETEELWNSSAIFMGGIVGPVRAIRYIRGAASGLNTIHHDIIYPDLWERHVDLRVHPLNSIWFYVDWLPGRVDRLFTASEPAGIAIDGQNDNGLSTTPVDWEVVRGDGGGLAVLYRVPPSPFVSQRQRYWRDDAAFDDAPVFPPDYPDEDDSAIGNNGFRFYSITSSETDDIPFVLRLYPLCGGVGDADAGAGFADLWNNPPVATATPEWGEVAPVRDLALSRSNLDITLSWNAVPGATGYRVYATDDPSTPAETWTLLSEPTDPGFVDPGAALGPDRYYSVAVVDASGQEKR